MAVLRGKDTLFFDTLKAARFFYFLLLRGRNDRNVRSVFIGSLEFDNTVAQGEEGVVFTHSHVLTRIVNGTSLADDNVASLGELTTEDLQT